MPPSIIIKSGISLFSSFISDLSYIVEAEEVEIKTNVSQPTQDNKENDLLSKDRGKGRKSRKNPLN